ncbi:MAG: autolysis histidine kinase LytS [Flavipsychrobacter sp.]|nr:autolysis histidine kinase LytS [Flavipsychrobacter sp.]
MKNPKKILFIYFASLVLVAVINFLGNYEYYMSGGDWHFSLFFSLGFTTFCWIIFGVLAELVFKRINWSDRPTFRILTGALMYAACGAVIMLIAQGAVSYLTHHTPPTQDLIINCMFSSMISMIIGLIVTAQQSLMHLKKTTEENEQMKQEMVQSQYETLKSQVNPHFLFNSLNTLTVMIPQQPEVAVTFVEQLSKVFRYSLQHSSQNTIEVETELKVVRSYLFLNEQRYEGKLLTVIELDEQAMQQKIITQSLLMLVENAIKHNELSTDKPLTLRIYNEGAYIVVANTLQRKSLIERSTNIGLDNIKKRYALATTIPVMVDEQGNNFTVKIPLLP